MSAKPRPPQRRRERKHHLPDFQPAAKPNVKGSIAYHWHRCPRSTSHQAPHHPSGRGAFERVATNSAPPHRVWCSTSAPARALSFAFQMRISRRSSPRIAASDLSSESHRVSDMSQFFSYREYHRSRTAIYTGNSGPECHALSVRVHPGRQGSITSKPVKIDPPLKITAATTATTPVTLQTVLDRLAARPRLTGSRQRDLRSAVTSFAKLRNERPERIPLDLAEIRAGPRSTGTGAGADIAQAVGEFAQRPCRGHRGLGSPADAQDRRHRAR